MTLLTTETMLQVQSIIRGTHQTPATMEGETYSVTCPHCKQRAWGFDSKPEDGLGGCPYCDGTLRFEGFRLFPT